MYQSVSALLIDEMNRRILKNSKYSIRAFARDLEISNSRLSVIIRTVNPSVSRDTIQKIVRSLKLKPEATDYFYLISKSNNLGRGRLNKIDKNKLQQYLAQQTYTHVSLKNSDFISHWYYPPVYTFATLNKYYTNKYIAKRLNITESEVAEAIQHLFKNNYITSDKYPFSKSDKLYKIESKTPSVLIQDTHTKLASLSIKALKVQPIENRKYMSAVLVLDKKNLQNARNDIENFFLAFTKKYSHEAGADSVYCAGLQFFQLDSDGAKES